MITLHICPEKSENKPTHKLERKVVVVRMDGKGGRTVWGVW